MVELNDPRQLPVLREQLLQLWGQGGLFRRVNEIHIREVLLGPGDDVPMTNPHNEEEKVLIRSTADWATMNLPASQLWWVDEDACELLAQAAPEWPDEHVLTLDDAPVLAGIAVFAHDLEGHDAYSTDQGVRISAIQWGPCTLPSSDKFHIPEQDGMSVLIYCRPTAPGVVPFIQSVSVAIDRSLRYRRLPLVYIGRTDWVFGMTATEPTIPGHFSETTALSMAEDRRLLAALWALVRTPAVVTPRLVLPDRPTLRRAQRAHHSHPTVTVLTLRARQESLVAHEHEPVKWTHRWMVSTHWRMQPYGPGLKLRRPQLIQAYPKGPEGLPIKGGDRVWRVVKPRQDTDEQPSIIIEPPKESGE